MAESDETPIHYSLIKPGSIHWSLLATGSRHFDLTHGIVDNDKGGLNIEVSTGAYIQVNPSKCALVIIDMQNYFLSAALGRQHGAGHEACDKLAQYAIPAARKAGIQILWVNWGLTREDMATMPPAVTKCFGIDATNFTRGDSVILDRHGVVRTDRKFAELGGSIGKVVVPKAEAAVSKYAGKIDAGDLLFRDTWNADIYGPFLQYYEPLKGDKLLHKNRMSALWSNDTPLQKHLEANGITTLFFAGVNTDQCVGGTLTDAFSRGYDCILLSDGCGTSSPSFAQQAWEYNCENTFGFVTNCSNLWDAAMGVK